MLSEIAGLLEEHGALTLRELSSRFHMDPAAIEPMLDLLVQKGRIEVLTPACGKGSCGGCVCADREDMISYRIAVAQP